VSVKVEAGKNQGNKLYVPCGVCKHLNNHLIVADVSLEGREDWEDDFFWWDNQYQIVQCLGCETITFRYTHKNSEDMQQTGRDEYESVMQVELYPNPEAGRLPIADVEIVPGDLQRIYEETLKTLNTGQRVLTGMGIRAIVETVCKDRQAKGGDLSKKINDLVSQGVLSQDGATILHKLRTLGNEAAHEVKPHSNVHLGLAMDVIDHLLQGVYILPYHATKKFK
jgi:hypothetical protein